MLLLYRLKHGRKAIHFTRRGEIRRALWKGERVCESSGKSKKSEKTYRDDGSCDFSMCALHVGDVKFGNEKLFWYAMKIRTPKLIVMLITAFAIGGASIVFQSIINNTIVTPCLLGMNSLYMVIHTAVVFVAGSGSVLAVNPNAAFAVDLVLMGGTATVIYSYLFKKQIIMCFMYCL